ncbi:MAG: metallophosphoesterase [Paraclostridium sp.]|uniref:metallophosphoesterase n=1 Tax=Paraclostridium sp. TaxID=2023273 RepID=UPI003F3E5086
MKKKILGGVLGMSMLLIGGCTSTKTADINVLATTDVHGVIPYELNSYVENEKNNDKNITLVDAGDFLGSEFGTSEDMLKFFDQGYQDIKNGEVIHRYIPIAKEMKKAGYDTVTLGNHEFLVHDKYLLDNMIADFEKQGISVLSANTYKKNGDSYTKPYVIKEIETPEGTVKLGILGLTIKEVGESKERVGDKLVPTKSLELKDQKQFHGELYMNDLVEDAKKWVKVMQDKDKADVIVAVAHTGEKPEKPKHPGNRIQDLAQQVDGIDAIVAGHNHVQIKQHDYKNKSGETVIVTEPGKHGECISKINFKLEKNRNGWVVADKSSDIVQFEESKKNLKQLFDNGVELNMGIYELNNKLGEKISLSKISSLKWDKGYVFKPGTPRKKIYDTVGYEFFRISESDHTSQVILMKGDKVVFYSGVDDDLKPYTMNFKNGDFKYGVLTILPGKNDYFRVEQGERNPITNRASIKLNYIDKE